jgi:hypothetical protein
MATGRHLAGILIGGVGVAAVLRTAFKDGGGALLLIGVCFLALGGYLIFSTPRGPSAEG